MHIAYICMAQLYAGYSLIRLVQPAEDIIRKESGNLRKKKEIRL